MSAPKLVECGDCGKQYVVPLTKCPYCGTKAPYGEFTDRYARQRQEQKTRQKREAQESRQQSFDEVSPQAFLGVLVGIPLIICVLFVIIILMIFMVYPPKFLP